MPGEGSISGDGGVRKPHVPEPKHVEKPDKKVTEVIKALHETIAEAKKEKVVSTPKITLINRELSDEFPIGFLEN